LKTFTGALLGIVALLAMTVIMSPDVGQSLQASLTNQARTDFFATVTLVGLADLSGATNDELAGPAERLNQALRLIELSEELDRMGNSPDADAAARQAIQILTDVNSDAASLQSQAERRTLEGRILTYAAAPILAVFVVLAYHLLLIANRRYRKARIMSMRIRVKSPA
jgi:hypothetical protein